ncbi:hypothetical protein QTP70_030008 [Hemibagrus guttatus]|uniref:Ig-like domain-containing protein n=1 Tax=Hemibagrus guttatus TaxID=175788 RepID=A0AAE0VFI1_9TELE|nr:hypothetical protein QTP70_030008 [Hemibagrus guttatus]KAK3573555.1 hypothetical protein QTP86_027837 [Hemibagrus guttatus]
MDSFMVLLSFLTTCAGIRVSVPAGRVVAVGGHPVILGCEFTPDSLQDLVVTWQRVDNSHVVHSFYYQKDQLELQSPEYHNRTALFVSELQNGNATLRMEPVGPSDVGAYLCSVSNKKGTGTAQVQLDYGVFYTEPRLIINRNCSGITLLYESEGFPKPEVGWFGEHAEVLSGHTDLSDDADGAGGVVGLYYVKSRYVSTSPSLNVTFKLKNQLLNQVLHRPISITYDGQTCIWGAKETIIALCVLCALLLLVSIILFAKRQRVSRDSSYKLTNGHTNGKHCHVMSETSIN